MKNDFSFKAATQEDVPILLRFILERIRWMDEQGIRQWNVSNYGAAYSKSYYERIADEGMLYALYDEKGAPLCFGALFEKDDRWVDGAPALYLHHFVSAMGARGAGKIFLYHAEILAEEKGKSFLRLDAAQDNMILSSYYERLGFAAVGTCSEGLYQGTLRQKEIKKF